MWYFLFIWMNFLSMFTDAHGGTLLRLPQDQGDARVSCPFGQLKGMLVSHLQNRQFKHKPLCLLPRPPGTRYTRPAGTPQGCWGSQSPWKRRPPSSGQMMSHFFFHGATERIKTDCNKPSPPRLQHGVRWGEDRRVPGQLRRASVGSGRGSLQDPGDGSHQAEGVRGRSPRGGGGPQLVRGRHAAVCLWPAQQRGEMSAEPC